MANTKLPEQQPMNNGSKWINDLIREVEEVDPELAPPAMKIDEKRDQHIATIEDPFLRKLFSLSSIYRREAQHAGIDLNYKDPSSDDYKETCIRGEQARVKHTTLNDIFWSTVRENFQLFVTPDQQDIGIRAGWLLVLVKSQQRGPMVQILGGEEDPEVGR